MVDIHVPVEVPENRKIELTLPPEVPTGPNELTVRVHKPETPPIELNFGPDFPNLPRGQNEKWRREYKAFLQMLPDLLTTYRGQYVAIHEGRVVDSDRAKIDLACRVYEKHGKTPICVRLVTEQPPPPARLPSFRVLRDGDD